VQTLNSSSDSPCHNPQILKSFESLFTEKMQRKNPESKESSASGTVNEV
jgi:hypothetical protein